MVSDPNNYQYVIDLKLKIVLIIICHFQLPFIVRTHELLYKFAPISRSMAEFTLWADPKHVTLTSLTQINSDWI